MRIKQCKRQTHFNKRNDSNELMVCPFKFPFTTTEKGLFKNHLYDIHNCPAMFGTDWQLKEHYVENHKLRIQCLFCPYQALTKHYMNRHRCKNNSFPYKCPSCPFKTATKCAIVQHNRDIHKQQVAFRCKVCPEQHQYTCNLRAHMFDVIPGKRKYIYKCPSCPLTEATERALMKHNRVVHNQQVVFRCKVCIKWRRDTCYPTGHPFVILIEKYECPSCRLKTATKAEIVKHNRFKHRQQVVFKCKECPAKNQYTCNSEEHFMDVLPIDQKYELSTLTAGQQQVIFYLIDNNKKNRDSGQW